MNLRFMARYPFSSKAKEYVGETQLQIDYDVIQRAKRRLSSALSKGEIPKLELELPESLEAELAAYAVARMMVSVIGSRFLISRYAVAESKRAMAYLKLKKGEEGLREQELGEISSQFGIALGKHGDDYSMCVVDYLQFTPKAVEYKLINRKLKDGRVLLKRSEFIRVVSEAIKKAVEETLPIDKSKIPGEVKKAAEEMKRELPKEEASSRVNLNEEDYPPCVKALLESLRLSENLPHNARFALSVYLLNTGKKVEEVMKVFSTAPDFDEKITRYQVEYANKKGYTMPGCRAMEVYGLCTANCRVKNPLNYRSRKARK